MVLGIRLILSLAGLSSACSGASTPTPLASSQVEQTDAALDRARLGKAEIVLVSSDGGCVVRVGAKDHALGIPAPCRFLRRDHSAQVTVHDYGGRGRVVMVAGPPAPAADYADRSGTPMDRCSSIARPILERDGRFALGDIMPAPVGYCPDIGLDEKFYYGVAHAKPFVEREPLR